MLLLIGIVSGFVRAAGSSFCNDATSCCGLVREDCLFHDTAEVISRISHQHAVAAQNTTALWGHNWYVSQWG